MKHIKLFEDFKRNNNEGELITKDDIIKCIKSNGEIWAEIIKDFPDNDPEKPLYPMSIDEDGLITVRKGTDEYEVDINDVIKISTK